MAIPIRLRLPLGEEFFLTRGLVPSINIYSHEQLTLIRDQFISLGPSLPPDEAQLARHLFSEACQTDIDSRGTILLPLHLRNYARIEREVIIVGAIDRVEIWNPELYEAHYKDIKIPGNTPENRRD